MVGCARVHAEMRIGDAKDGVFGKGVHETSKSGFYVPRNLSLLNSIATRETTSIDTTTRAEE